MAFNFSPKIVTSGLVLYLDAANTRSYPGSGTDWSDLTVNRNNGVLTNGATFDSTNRSILFDGLNDFVNVTGTITLTSATFISWILRNGVQIQWAGILYSRGTNVTGMGFNSFNLTLGYTWNDVANTYNWNSNLTIPNLAWCMCAITISPTAATAYLCQQSGITTAVNNVSHSVTTLNSIRVGADASMFGDRFFKGNIAVSQIYNKSLSASEILQNYNATKTRFGLT